MVRRRGRAGRGRGSAMRGRRQATRGTDQEPSHENELALQHDGSFDDTVKAIFIGLSTFQQHFDAQQLQRDRYLAILLLCRSKHVQLSEGSKSKALAAAWARKDHDLARTMLGFPDEEFGLKEVLKAVSSLDAGRSKRAHEKILRRLEAQGCKKKLKMTQLKSLIGSMGKEVLPIGSLSGALINHIKAWLKTIPTERLEFYALHFPTEPWKKLADICHLNPEKDLPQCPWFLNFVFGKGGPEGKEVSSGITAENVSQKVLESNVDYTVVRKFKTALDDKAKERIATYAPINTIIWYFEELQTPNVDKILVTRMENGEQIQKMPYGKLMERLDTLEMIKNDDGDSLEFLQKLYPVAEEQLSSFSLNLESPVVVIGDKSASMDVAIRTSNIIASLFTKIANAELVFFDSENIHPPFIPKTVQQVFELSNLIKADSCTTPAASLFPYFEQKKIVKTFVIVTDEGENGECEGYRFANLFKKYHEEVYPASLVFISFIGWGGHEMVNELKSQFPEFKPMCFDFSERRPDLTRLDHVFGSLSIKTHDFSAEIDQLEKQLTEKGLVDVIQSIKL